MKLIQFKIPDDTTDYLAYKLHYKRELTKAMLFTGLPFIAFFAVRAIHMERYIVGATLLLLSFLLGLSLPFVFRQTSMDAENTFYEIFFRSFIALFAFCMFYTIGIEANINRMPYLFIFTFLVFYALKSKEAWVWLGAIFILAAIELFMTDFIITPDVIFGLKIRFLFVFMILGFFSYMSSSLVRQTIRGLFEQQARLKESKSCYRSAFEKLEREMAERRRAEVASHKSETKYRVIADNVSDIISITDLNGRFSYVSPSVERVLGYSREDTTSSTLEKILTPESFKLASRTFKERLFTDGERKGMDCEPVKMDLEYIRKDGSRIWCEVTTKLLHDEKDQPIGIISVTRDITDRKQAEEALHCAREELEAMVEERTSEISRANEALLLEIDERKRTEEALRESKERYRELFDNISDIIYTHDMKGRILTVNRAAAQTLGFTLDELIGRPISNLLLPKYREAFELEYLSELKKKGFFNGVSKLKSKDGKVRYIEYRNVLVERDDSEPYANGVGRDITERIEAKSEVGKLEKQLLHAQKMEAIGTLAGGVAHDFNNLLLGIQGRTSIMLVGIVPSHPHYENLKGIEDYVKSAAELTKQLLGFARGGKYEVNPTDLNEIAMKTTEMFGRTKKEILIHKSYQDGIWTVEADQGQIEQVLLNLYVNAWQAMTGKGELYIETKNVILDKKYVKPHQVKPGKYVKLSVKDNGVGMDRVTLERIFEPFFTTKEMGRGTGLGLASAYGIVKNHDGFIEVHSEKGRGTTFNIYLPAVEAAVRKKREPPEELLQGMETVLLVDDEHLILEIGREMMESLGYKVRACSSGREAIEIYKKDHNEINLILLDMIMPEMGGKETYEHLKQINPDVRVLLSSGYSFEEDAKQIIDKGCAGFIQKPFALKDLSKMLRKVLDA